MLDGDENREERKEVIKRLFGTENPTFDEMRAFVRNMNQETLRNFDDLIKSRWIWGKHKANLRIFRNLIKMNGENEIDSLSMWEYVGNLNNAVLLPSEKIQKNQTRTEGLEEALSKLRKATTTQLTAMLPLIEHWDKTLEEQNKLKKEYDKVQDDLKKKKAEDAYRV
jgi:hypothetical protein